MKFPVYVAAPTTHVHEARQVSFELAAIGCIPSSRWLHGVVKEDFSDPIVVQNLIAQNDEDVINSGAMIFLAYKNEGGESFCELARAIMINCPVLWVGQRTILSTYRRGVYQTSLKKALEILKDISTGCKAGGSLTVARIRLHRFMTDSPNI